MSKLKKSIIALLVGVMVFGGVSLHTASNNVAHACIPGNGTSVFRVTAGSNLQTFHMPFDTNPIPNLTIPAGTHVTQVAGSVVTNGRRRVTASNGWLVWVANNRLTPVTC